MLTVRIPDDLRDAIDAKRGAIPRERMIRMVLGDWAESVRCPDCGKANGVHKGDCPAHPRAGR